MSTIVESFRKHQRMIVLGIALSIIAVYIIPVDHIYASQTSDRIKLRFQAIRDHIDASNAPYAVKIKVQAHLQLVEDRLLAKLA